MTATEASAMSRTEPGRSVEYQLVAPATPHFGLWLSSQGSEIVS